MPDPALQRMRRDMADHQRRAPRVALRGAWIHLHQRGGIPRRTGGTAASAKAGTGRPVVRRVVRRRGDHHPPKGRGESDRSTRAFKVGQNLYITTDHPGGLYARGMPGRTGFHKTADHDARRAFEAWRWKRRRP